MENKFSEKYFQLTVCFIWFDPEIVWSENFHFKPFLDSRAKRERERERAQINPQTELQFDDHRPSSNPTTTDRSRRIAPHQLRPTPAPIHTSTNQAKIDSNDDHTAPIDSKVWRPTLASIADRTAPIKQRSTPTPLDLASATWCDEFFFGFCFFCVSVWPDLMNFFSRFCFFCVSVLRNDIIYLFGKWENVRKYEQQVENVFSMVFSRTQPNTRKYFSKHFLKCNQTLENIFLSRK